MSQESAWIWMRYECVSLSKSDELKEIFHQKQQNSPWKKTFLAYNTDTQNKIPLHIHLGKGIGSVIKQLKENRK